MSHYQNTHSHLSTLNMVEIILPVLSVILGDEWTVQMPHSSSINLLPIQIRVDDVVLTTISVKRK